MERVAFALSGFFTRPVRKARTCVVSLRRGRTHGRSRGVVFAVADRTRENLEYNWRYQDPENRRPVECPDCGGTGEKECGWCNTTGVLMLGDRLICSIDGTTSCQACKNGFVKCRTCRGNGSIAAWLLPK